MAGYLGTKAVFLSTTAASVTGNSTITGDLTVDTDTLYVDSTNNRVGIGTSSPSANLNVASSNATVHLTDTDDTTYAEIRNNGGTFTIASDEGAAASNSSINFRVDGTEAMRIDSNGNVGIGTTSPSSQLHIHGAAPAFTVKDSRSKTWVAGEDLGSINFDSSDASNTPTTVAKINVETDDGSAGTYTAMTFSTATPSALSERMRIDSRGNLLVGATNATGMSTGSIANAGSFIPAGGGLWAQKNNDGVIYCSKSSGYTSSTMIAFWTAGSIDGSITTSGTSISYNTTSDYRLKEDVQPMTGASERVLALNPVNFAWKIDGSRVDGFLAHEAQAIVPEAVTGSKDAMRTQDVYDEDGNVTGTEEVPDYQGIDQSKLVPLLTAALQEALTEIADLKARVTALEGV